MVELQVPIITDDLYVLFDFEQNEITIKKKRGKIYELVETIDIFSEDGSISSGSIYFKRADANPMRIIDKNGNTIYPHKVAQDIFEYIEKIFAPKPKKDAATTMIHAKINGGFKRIENTNPGHDKFWEYKVEGSNLIRQWGRIGTRGNSKIDSFASASAAEREGEKIMGSKIRKGYVRVN